MIIDKSPQGSEAWEAIRKGKATASEFNRILTPAKLQFASGAKAYACEKVAELLGVDSEKAMPSYWMERGTELEPYAKMEFAQRVQEVQEVGFIMPFEGARYGCSVDGLVGDDAILEIKCPAPETLIEWHYWGVVPPEHRLQIQGGLWITGRKTAHFLAWHPEIKPLLIQVPRDQKYIDALEDAMPKFTALVDEILAKVTRRTAARLLTEYQSEEIEL